MKNESQSNDINQIQALYLALIRELKAPDGQTIVRKLMENRGAWHAVAPINLDVALPTVEVSNNRLYFNSLAIYTDIKGSQILTRVFEGIDGLSIDSKSVTIKGADTLIFNETLTGKKGAAFMRVSWDLPYGLMDTFMDNVKRAAA